MTRLASLPGRAWCVLEAVGYNIFHAGETSAGQTFKISNNILLGRANGLDSKVQSEFIRCKSGGH